MAKTSIEKYHAYLFEDREEVEKRLSNLELIRFQRIKQTFVHWLEFPELTDKKIRDFLMVEFDLETSQAYRDISVLKQLLGNVRNASKEWHRYTVIEMLKESYLLAKEQMDPKAMAIAADKLGKYNNLDKENPDTPDWSDFEPQNVEIVDDVTILDLEKLPKEEEQRLREKYLGKTYEDATIIEDE
jgi:hypothetical protein